MTDIESYCDRVIPVHDGPNVLANDPEVVKGLEVGFHGLRGRQRLATTIPKTRRLVRAVLDDLAVMAREVVKAGETYDIAVHHVSGAGHDVAEFLGVPSVLMCPQPYWVPTSSFPDPSFPWRVPPYLNRLTYFASKSIWWMFSGSTTRWRKNLLGLNRRPNGRYRQPDGDRTVVLHPFSELLLPPNTDYPAWVHTTGFWLLPAAQEWAAPATLERFLAAGEPPVFLGFASTVSSRPKELGRLLTEAVEMAGVRAVVGGGWSGLDQSALGPGIAFVDNAPFDWLFERVSAIVHHGGLGTTGLAMASGRPQVACPLLPDQRFSARQLHALGVAPQPIHQRDLTAERLADAIRRVVHDARYAVRAADVATHIHKEDGVAASVQILESIVKHQRRPAMNGITVTEQQR